MTYQQKLIFISILPILLIAAAIFFLFEQQSKRLLERQAEIIEEVILEQKRGELRNFVSLAEKAIAPSYNSVLKTRRRAQSEANEILRKMSANQDQYYFVYNSEGEIIVEPRLSWFVGKNWSRLQDREGRFIIQETIEASKEDNAFVSYVWQKPSTKDYTQKLVHATYFPKWDWIVGTGIYLDDIDHQIAAIQSGLTRSLDQTQRQILIFALGAVLITTLILTFFQVSQQRLANAELRRLNEQLNVVQEAERKRVATELHDGISQLLVTAKYGIENAIQSKSTKSGLVRNSEQALSIIDQSIAEVRRISRALRPTVLDDMGLAAALNTLSNDFENSTSIVIKSDVKPVKNLLSDESKTALYRVAQEALTNIAKHAKATEVELGLAKRGGRIVLTIVDNGIGFDRAAPEFSKGLGLQNITERIDRFGGSISIIAKPGAGCKLTARLPLEQDQSKQSI